MKKQYTNQNEETTVKNLPVEFYKLLNKAILYSPTEDRTNESPNSSDYNEKQTHSRRSVNTLD